MAIKTVERAELTVVGMAIRTQPLFERHDEAMDPGDPASLVEIGLPVRRRA